MGKKLWITTGIIGALAAAYTAGGFLGVPYGVNWALKKYAEPIVGARSQLRKLNSILSHCSFLLRD